MRNNWLIMILFGACAWCLGAVGPQIFSDDFETVGLFAEHWTATKGVKPHNGVVRFQQSGNITLRQRMAGKNFVVSVDFTPSQQGKKEFQHAGIIIDGIHFMLRSDGKIGTAYRPPTYKRSLGSTSPIPGYRMGDKVTLSVMRQHTGKSRKYVFSANGQALISFQDSSMQVTDTVKIYAYRADVTIDNVVIHTVSVGSDSPNLAINSSFEHLLDGMPPYVNLSTRRRLTWMAPFDDYLKTAVIDSEERHSGKRSLRLTFNPAVHEAGFMMYNMGCQVGKPVTGSVWLKSKQPSQKALLVFWELHSHMHTKPIVVTDSWQRFDFTLPKPGRSMVQFGAILNQPGVLWADDVQVESGTEVTDYHPSSLDVDKFGQRPSGSLSALAEIKVPAITRAPAIDGDLSDFPKQCQISSFKHKGTVAPAFKTLAWLACDAENLYVAMECHAGNVSKLKSGNYPRDFGKIYHEESIELFFDPLLSGQEYYQLAMNTSGSQADCGPGRNPAWNGEWTYGVKKDAEKNVITYEIAVPFSDFAHADIQKSWGFNLGRNSTEAHQSLSLLRTTEQNYHLPAIFPRLTFPQGILAQARIGFENSGLFEGTNNKAMFQTTVRNLTGRSHENARMQLLDAQSGQVLGETACHVRPGNNAVSIVTALNNSAKNKKLVIRMQKEGGRTLACKSVLLTAKGPLSMYSRYSFYTPSASGEFIGRCDLPKGNYTGTVRVAGKSFAFDVRPELRIAFPLQGIAPGKVAVTFDIADAKGTVASTKADMVILADSKQARCQIDRQFRTLQVSGKPALIVAPLIGVEPRFTPEMSRNAVRLFASKGFKYLTCGSISVDNPQTVAFIEEANRLGINIVYWNFYAWRKHKEWNKAEVAEKIKRHPNVIAALMVDEPELYAPGDEVKVFMQEYQNAFAGLPVFMNNTIMGIPSRYADLTTDIVMIDDYLTNRDTRTVSEMLDGAALTEKAGRQERKPAWFFPSGDNMHNHYRECSFDEQLAQCYGMMIRGCTGLVHFGGLPKYPRNWEALQQINREFLSLQDIVFSEERCPETTSTEKAIAIMTRKMGDALYVIALNPNEKATYDIRLQLPGEYRYASVAKVAFESRRLAVNNGIIGDTFRPLARHVYRVELVR